MNFKRAYSFAWLSRAGKYVGFAHALHGVLRADKSYYEGILMTNGSFSPGCRAFVQGKTLELIDGAMLPGLAGKLNAK